MLKSLPKTLNNTYERILCGIDEEYCDYARKILHWLTYSVRTLSLAEVAEIVAMDAREEPRFNAENRFFDSREILVICSSLVSVFTEPRYSVSKWHPRSNKAVPCIKLAHFSVKEYLVSVDIRNGPANMYAISCELANASIAESCLALLLHFDKRDSLTSQLESESREDYSSSEKFAREKSLHLQFERKFPLAQYAAKNWIEHAHNASYDNPIGDLVSELFLKRDTLENWIRLHDPDEPWASPKFLRPSIHVGPSMYYSSGTGFLKPLKQFIETGADVNAPGGEYGNALQAASYNGHQEIIHLLLNEGADVNAAGGRYSNALQAASSEGHQQIVKMLLDAGADINAQGRGYESALQAASSEGHQQIVKMLLDAGADVNAQGRGYESALQAASSEGHQQIVKMLLDAGAEVNAQGGFYGNALQAASCGGNQQIVRMLLDAGADVNVQGGYYGNALQAASCGGNQQIVRMLLDAGADVNVQGGYYGSALHAASSRGHQQIVKMLLDAEAEVNTQGGFYRNALQAASSGGNQQIVKMLLDAGADVNA